MANTRLHIWWQSYCFLDLSQFTNMPIERPHATFCVHNSNVCPICHRFRDNHVWTSQCAPFESLTFKMKVKDVDNLDENCQTDDHVNLHVYTKLALLGQAVYSQYIIVHFVAYQRTNAQTDRRTDVVCALIQHSTLLERCKNVEDIFTMSAPADNFAQFAFFKHSITCNK